MAESEESDKVPPSTINKVLFFFFLSYYRHSCATLSPITGLANKRNVTEVYKCKVTYFGRKIYRCDEISVKRFVWCSRIILKREFAEEGAELGGYRKGSRSRG